MRVEEMQRRRDKKLRRMGSISSLTLHWYQVNFLNEHTLPCLWCESQWDFPMWEPKLFAFHLLLVKFNINMKPQALVLQRQITYHEAELKSSVVTRWKQNEEKIFSFTCVSEVDTWRESWSVCLLPSGSNLKPEQNHYLRTYSYVKTRISC